MWLQYHVEEEMAQKLLSCGGLEMGFVDRSRASPSEQDLGKGCFLSTLLYATEPIVVISTSLNGEGKDRPEMQLDSVIATRNCEARGYLVTSERKNPKFVARMILQVLLQSH
nr:hypothetical protein CFP56_07418 [Quercus suber]